MQGYNFNRVIKVKLYNSENELTVEIIGSGKENQADIKIEYSITNEQEVAKASVIIYNISRDTELLIMEAKKIYVYANYENESDHLLFVGIPLLEVNSAYQDKECSFDIGVGMDFISEVSLDNCNISLRTGNTLKHRIEVVKSLIQSNQNINTLKIDDSYLSDFSNEELNQKLTALSIVNYAKFTNVLNRLFKHTIIEWVIENDILSFFRKDYSIYNKSFYYIELKGGDGGNIIRIEQAKDELNTGKLYDNFFKQQVLKNPQNTRKRNSNAVLNNKMSTINLSIIYSGEANINLKTIYKLDNMNNIKLNDISEKFLRTISSADGFYRARKITYKLASRGTSDDWQVDLELIAKKT